MAHAWRSPDADAGLRRAADHRGDAGSIVVWQGSEPVWLRNCLMVVLLLVAFAGWLMTFRDLSPRAAAGRSE